jgi:hypothetical protein
VARYSDHDFAQRPGASGSLRRQIKRRTLRYASTQAAFVFFQFSPREIAMLSSRCQLADDLCPISDELLGELLRANDLCVPSFVCTLAPDIRALLALFCYRRSHLHSMGLGIAASCDKDNLVKAGGSVGTFLFASSRERASRIALSPRGDRRKITLATGVVRTIAAAEELVPEAS